MTSRQSVWEQVWACGYESLECRLWEVEEWGKKREGCVCVCVLGWKLKRPSAKEK